MLEFTIPGRAPATSSPNARINWRGKHSAAKDYGETVLLLAYSALPSVTSSCAVLHAPGERCSWQVYPLERAVVTVTQRAMRLRDHDNFAASFKPGLDAIVRAGIIADDNPGCIDLVLRAEKVAHKADECVLVTIERKE